MKKRFIILEIIILIVVLGIGVTFAFLSTIGNQEQANTFTSGCLNITLKNESNSISITNAVPETDLNGLKEDGYTFTIENTCSTPANYAINLESLSNPSDEETLNANYLKVALSSDTFDNIITKLSDNSIEKSYLNNAYTSYNLYNGTIDGKKTKTFTLKEWIDNNVTKEQGLNKTIRTSINVISGTNHGENIIPSEVSEIKFKDTTGTIIGDSTNIKYCISKDNSCTPNQEITATNNKIEVTLESEESKKTVATSLGNIEVNVIPEEIICTKINENKTICSNPINRPYFDGSSCDEVCVQNGFGCSKGCVYQENGIYEAEDDDGTSYYYRGTVENNYVKFGKTDVQRWYKYDNSKPYQKPKYYTSQQDCEKDTEFSAKTCTKLYDSNEDIWWRIIRINGDGSIRMIYAGTSADGLAPEQTGEGTMIGSYEFKSYSSDVYAEYVGYQYTLGERNGHETDSDAKKVLDKWFEENLGDEFTKSDSIIDRNAGFCGDRSAYSGELPKYRDDTIGVGMYTKTTFYGGYIRALVTAEPTFLCEDKEHDLFTHEDSNQGTKSLKYPVGLITIDEVVYAGGHKHKNNKNYYLYNGKTYWTISPYMFWSDGFDFSARIFRVDASLLSFDYSLYPYGLRPVINLTAGSIISGDGTSTDPYRTV